MISRNHSYFYVPFRVKNVEAWRNRIESLTFDTERNKNITVWEKICDSVPAYLMKFINDGVGYQTERQYAYKLMDKRAYGLPYTDKNRKLLTCFVNRKGVRREFLVDICSIKIHCFGTGVGALVYDVWYSDNMEYDDILEFNYLFRKIGTIHLQIKDAAPFKDLEGYTYLYQLSKHIISNGLDSEVELFFYSINKVRMECNVFSIYCDDQRHNTKKKLFYLSHSYTSDYEYNKKDLGKGFRTYCPYLYMNWGYCQDGIACIYYDTCEFTHGDLDGKLQNDYYFMYLILLHQRYMTVSLMNEMMNCKEADSEEWKRIQQKLLIYRMEYSFNIVSDEMQYHEIYKDVRKILSIDEFEKCLNDISDRMYRIKRQEQEEQEERDANIRNWRTDIALWLLSLLTVFSAFVDSTDLISEWFSVGAKSGPLWAYGIAYVIIIVVMLIVIYFLIKYSLQYKEYKKSVNRNKEQRRK